MGRGRVTEQAATLAHVSNLWSTEPQQELAGRLTGAGRVPADVFFANSGAEANEAALKIARKHGRADGRLEVVCLEGSFHGRTFATLAATGQPAKHAPFEPLAGRASSTCRRATSMRWTRRSASARRPC